MQTLPTPESGATPPPPILPADRLEAVAAIVRQEVPDTTAAQVEDDLLARGEGRDYLAWVASAPVKDLVDWLLTAIPPPELAPRTLANDTSPGDEAPLLPKARLTSITNLVRKAVPGISPEEVEAALAAPSEHAFRELPGFRARFAAHLAEVPTGDLSDRAIQHLKSKDLWRIAPASFGLCHETPSCERWLAGWSTVEPRRVCYFAASASAGWFAGSRPGYSPPTHPIPAGERPVAQDAAAFRQKYLDDDDDRPYPTPLLAHFPEARVGLAAVRTNPTGIVWLLGLVEPVPYEDATRFEPGLILGGAVSDAYYRFGASIMLGEGDLTLDLMTRAWECQRWYDRRVKGEILHEGRPVGSIEYTGSREQLIEECRTAFASLRKKGDRLIQDNLSRELGYSRRTLYRYLYKQFHIPWPELKRLCGVR